MPMIDSLIAEFAHETETTRRHLERLPEEKIDWRPHEKSFTALGLASHIVECVGWASSIFSDDGFDFDPKTYQPARPASVAAMLAAFDENVASGKRALSAAGDADLAKTWSLRVMGRVRFEKTKAEVLRDFTLSHLIHHRGQFTVYLRLMDVPVPGSYGPTADEGV
jgi:uncharacterized damage-inducible protein DinB